MYDCIIIGGGISGLTASLYLARAGIKTLVLESNVFGGQIINAQDIENYPGINNISGYELIDNLCEQVKSYDCIEIKNESVIGIDDNSVKTKENTYQTKTIIVACGLKKNVLGLEHESELIGSGISYCASCDGAFFKSRDVAVVGGGNVALEDAIFLSRMCKKVYLIHRRDEFRGAKILQDEVKKNDKIEILWNTIVTKIDGDEVVEKLHIQDVDNHVDKLLDVDGIFIAVGTKPASELLSGKLSTDEKGYIIAGEDGVTNIPGIFAAGDGRSKNLRQVVTAVSDGANCVYSVERYLQNA